MEFLSVLLATVAAFALGAGYYGALAKPWMEAARIPRGPDGRPKGADDKKIYAIAFVLQLVVAGMMRHVFALSGIETLGAGLVGGAGVGLFFISPWLALNNLYGMRPAKLTLIDGGYAALACAVMGLVLTLF
ncbi:DUF1761 domain-containing protein [Cribrihabitans neustonicus]|uniref:DUF1761 domain-containing protein n=1 Tax=Cribrihabitans neustonicus TaxID=1429085 RepID=UPI003B5964C4